MRLTGASEEAISWPPSPHAKSALGQCPGFIAGQTYSGRVARDRDERGFQSMWRQLGALLLVLALVFGATYFLGISVVARSNFAFDTSDVLSSAAGMWFALFGGLIARQYRFAIIVGVLYVCLWGMATYFVNAGTQAGFLPIFRINAPNVVVSVLSGMAGACVGVFVRSGPRRAEAEVHSEP